SYSHERGFGSAHVTLTEPITSYRQVQAVNEYLEQYTSNRGVIVLFFHALSGDGAPAARNAVRSAVPAQV
ncbi:MAG TPA: hypothetical protein VGN37_11515, partial [Actinocatenispora sp.]